MHHFDRPPHSAGVALVERGQVASKQRSLFATGAGTDLDDAVATVIALIGEQHVDEGIGHAQRACLQLGQLRARKFGQVGICPVGQQRAMILELSADAAEGLVVRDDPMQCAEFFLDRSETVWALGDLGIRGQGHQLALARNHPIETGLNARSQMRHARVRERRNLPRRSPKAAASGFGHRDLRYADLSPLSRERNSGIAETHRATRHVQIS